MKLLDTLNDILNQRQELPVKCEVEVDTTSVIKACSVVLAMLVLYAIIKRLL